ncbi:MAG TPA: hypothetical protein VGO91_09355 [Pyrinomonadaceae bacterium]|nr:hypothetical protein [Pyrinomonadaceae bacterium]
MKHCEQISLDHFKNRRGKLAASAERFSRGVLRLRMSVRGLCALTALLVLLMMSVTGCRTIFEKQSVRPRSLRDVPSQRLAYRFEADTATPSGAATEDAQPLSAVQNDFNSRRQDDALVRTVLSPDGQRALALYETGEDRPGEFRIDMYSSDGHFLRNVTPPDLSGAFPMMVAWSPDGNHIAFIGRKSIKPQPTPPPLPDMMPEGAASPLPTTSVAPLFAPVPVYNTEQLYFCNRDGFDLKPLTSREGLIYFYLAWAPDGHALASLACKEAEWDARERESKLPAGRARLIWLDGQERLLDDALTEALPVWSPDGSKVATAFDTDVAIYDAAAPDAQTGARIALRDPLLASSAAYDENRLRAKNKKAGETGNTNGGTTPTSSSSTGVTPPPTSAPPVSFNPIVSLNWPQTETLYLKTAFVRTYENNPMNNFQRWHVLHLSPQAALLQ